jgi:hypothetical protein
MSAVVSDAGLRHHMQKEPACPLPVIGNVDNGLKISGLRSYGNGFLNKNMCTCDVLETEFLLLHAEPDQAC